MKNIQLLFLICLFILSACQESGEVQTLKDQLEQAHAALAAAQSEIEALNKPSEDVLTHIVYFKLKEDLSQAEMEEFIKEAKRLEAIDQVKSFQLGTFEDLGDTRALSDYGMVMQMTFASKEDYAIYQANAVHLEVREKLGKYMGGPPATYDFSPN